MTNWIWCIFLNKGIGRQNIGGDGHSIQGGGQANQGEQTLHTKGTDTLHRGDGQFIHGGWTLQTGGTDTTYRGEEHFINRDGYLIYRGHTLYTVGGGMDIVKILGGDGHNTKMMNTFSLFDLCL